MERFSRDRVVSTLIIGMNSFLSIFLMIEIYLSLQWRMVHDSPILYYMGYLIAHRNAIPYRDFFDMNMPGAHWINAMAGMVFGFSDSGFQRANVCILITILILIFIWLRSFNRLAAWTGSLLFGIAFLQYGPAMSFQREFLALPFILSALIMFTVEKRNLKIWGLIISGLLIGLSVLIKPQTGLILPILLVIHWFKSGPAMEKRDTGLKVRQIACMIAGFLLPLGCTILYFGINNSLPAFFDVAYKYWPLYSDINARLELASGWQRVQTAFAGIISPGMTYLWLIPAGYGSFRLLTNSGTNDLNKQKIILMILSATASFVEVIIANKYWEYHWIPMILFLILLSASGLGFLSSKLSSFHFLTLFIVAALLLRPSNYVIDQVTGLPIPAPQGGRVDEIARYLGQNLDQGDTVQPLDWSNGAVHAMLVSQLPPATRYLYDFHFYHHISNPYIQYLRVDFLEKLKNTKPKVIIQFTGGRPWVEGIDTTRYFPELDTFLQANYYIDVDRNGYRLWMRK